MMIASMWILIGVVTIPLVIFKKWMALGIFLIVVCGIGLGPTLVDLRFRLAASWLLIFSHFRITNRFPYCWGRRLRKKLLTQAQRLRGISSSRRSVK